MTPHDYLFFACIGIFIAGAIVGAVLMLVWFMWTEDHDRQREDDERNGYAEDVRRAEEEGYDWS